MIDRKNLIQKMRDKRMTYREIGEALGITHQRVHQIYKDYISTDPVIRGFRKKMDNNKCAICNSTENIEVHHINGIKKDNNLENLVTLCRDCHKRVEKVDNRAKEIKFYKKARIKKICPRCSSEFEVLPSGVKKKYCTLECFAYLKSMDPEERRKIVLKRNNENMQRYYHEVLKKKKDFKEIVRKRNKKNYIRTIKIGKCKCGKTIIRHSKACTKCRFL